MIFSYAPPSAYGLLLQDADEVGVGHGREGVIAHAALVQQHIPHEQIALVDGPLIGREGGAGDREVGPERVHERLSNRPDIAARGGVESGAIFEIELTAATRLQVA